MDTECPESYRPLDPRCNSPTILILVVHNVSHHGDNMLRLAEQIVEGNSRMRLAVFCESSEVARVKTTVCDPETRVLALGNGERAAGAAMPVLPARRIGHYSSRIVRAYLRLRKSFKGKSKFGRVIFDAIEYNTLACVVRGRIVEQRYAAKIRDTQRLFDQLRPDIVLAWGDRHLDLELPALVVAKQRGIKVLLPYVSFSNYRGMLWSRRLVGEPKRWTPFSAYRLMANVRLKKMVREGYFFQEPHVLFALRRLGALSSNPWTIGCGLSQVVCVDSAMTLRRYVAEGVPTEKLRIVGSPEFDVLHHGMVSRGALKKSLAERYGFIAGKPLMIIALPQFAEQGVFPWPVHWSELRYVLTQLSRAERPMLVSLHPRMQYDSYRFLESEFDVRLSQEPLKQILPAADVFVAVNSSTLVWAVMCGVRAFMLDFYGLDSSEFARFKSITPLRRRDRLFGDLTAGLDTKADFAGDWELLSKDAVFDGKVIERYRALVGTLAHDPPVRAGVGHAALTAERGI